jgi:outer membrane receptor protein involved in Fe transport
MATHASLAPMARTRAAILIAASLAGSGVADVAYAQQQPVLEEIIVTSQRREENVQNVPLSVTPLSGKELETLFEGGDDIRALAVRVPSLYAESSNGRLAPRFYIRGLGNTDFDLAASQPVSVIVDDVVLENVILKSFPLFDLNRVEVLRGPQGSLFGRNTPAGVVKFETNRPSQQPDASIALTYGDLGTANFEGELGGPIGDKVSARISALYQSRDNWIDNDFTGQNDAMGGFHEAAYRAQLLLEPSDAFSLLFNIHGRDNDGTASVFRANVLGPGSDGFNSNYDRNTVSFDEGDNNPQDAQGTGGSVRLDWGLTDSITLTSITAYEQTEDSSLGDIDGGHGADFLGNAGPCPPGWQPGQPCIPFNSQTMDGIDNLDQRTEEIRLASQATDQLYWQGGVFYFDSEFAVTTTPFFVPPTTVVHENTAWALFGNVSYDFTGDFTLTGGLRYTDDDKDLSAFHSPLPVAPVSVSDEQWTGDISALYRINDDLNVYGRYARGFRAPTIQGRDIAFFGQPSVADSETIDSIEGGIKSELGDRVRLNGSIYYYQINDPQLSAIGGAGNLVQLVNADKGTGMGFDVDGQFLITDRFQVTAGLSWTDTEIQDDQLRVSPCGDVPTVPGFQGHCTVTDPLDANGNAIVDGNPFPQAPDYIFTLTADYRVPAGPNGEVFFSTDWAFQGETNFFIYESKEFKSDSTFEGGLRIGYARNDGAWEIAGFARNVTDEENVKGGIDFNNLTGFDNEPRIIGLTFRMAYHP